jgi:hypothetical protein
VLKPQDVLVTLKLAALPRNESVTFASLAKSLGMSVSETFSATRRAAYCHLILEEAESPAGAARHRPALRNVREFLVSGLRYVFPAEAGKAARGFCTAQDAPPLAARLVRMSGELPLVWAHPEGDTRGLSVPPLYRTAPMAAQRDPVLYIWLALADALRVGDARVRGLATSEIDKLTAELEHARRR